MERQSSYQRSAISGQQLSNAPTNANNEIRKESMNPTNPTQRARQTAAPSSVGRRRPLALVVSLLSVFMIVSAACIPANSAAPAITAQPAQPKNIIIMFADGVSATHLETARYAAAQMRSEPFAATDTFFKTGALGLMSSHASDSIATDSAAAGSAMSTGQKTTVGTLSMTPDGRPLTTAMEAAKAVGKRIGLVTTATVYDATPAAFSVRARSRRDYQQIVDQYLALEPDVILGGGADFFLPKEVPGGKRDDGQDIVRAFAEKGYQVATNVHELRTATGPRLLGLFDEEDMDHEIDRDPSSQPSIAEMAEAAIRILAQGSPNGFVVLIETENTDTAAHRNDIAALLQDLWVFDEAVQHALRFQRNAPSDTLVILTGDHDTGGLSITYAQKDFSTLSSNNRFYAAPEHLQMTSGITISLLKAAAVLGARPSPEALDALVATHFPGFRLDADLREAILGQRMLDLNYTYPTENALGRMVARQTGVYWGTAGHTTQPVAVGALGPGAGRFTGYMDNTEFGVILHQLISGR